jgi:uncharacterized protein with ATP-grasp and redox domains
MEINMLSITDGGSLARALSAPINPWLKRLLKQRSDQLGGNIAEQARFIIMQPADTLEDLEQQLSFSVVQNPIDGSRFGDQDFTPAFEYVVDHDFCFEAVFIFTDDGFAHVLFVEKAEGVDPLLIALCQTYASEHA